MKQNKYDDPVFFEQYDQMPRSVRGLDAATEWPYFRSVLPDVSGKRVLDLGCGFGWHSRYVRERGARHVLGIDLSENMLTRARMLTKDAGVEYRSSAIEDLSFIPGQFDIVISSLALHYVQDFGETCRRVFEWLANPGSFVFSVEHPIFTACPDQDWCLGPSGERLHWPVDNYFKEGIRTTHWLTDNVVKYHRTISSYTNALIDCGFVIAKLEEPTLPSQYAEHRPDSNDEPRRPMFLLLSGVKLH